jgi:ATP-dependent exoDNAse (exonuclease V) beta subunit
MQYTKINGDIAFSEADHKYVNVRYPQREYISVTTLIGKFHEHFDTDFWSKYKALEELTGDEFKNSGIKTQLLTSKKFHDMYVDKLGVDWRDFESSIQRFLDKWQLANQEACDRGTLYHNAQEVEAYTKATRTTQDSPFMVQLEGEFECVRNNFDLNIENAEYREYLLNFSTEDGILNLAGQADIILKKGNDIYIYDYKTNVKGIETTSYVNPKTRRSVKMFAPLQEHDDCNLIHYTIQLSLYAYMLQRINPELNVKLLRIIHVDKDFKETTYDLPYLKKDIEKMLLSYKKDLIIANARLTGKTVGDPKKL